MHREDWTLLPKIQCQNNIYFITVWNNGCFNLYIYKGVISRTNIAYKYYICKTRKLIVQLALELTLYLWDIKMSNTIFFLTLGPPITTIVPLQTSWIRMRRLTRIQAVWHSDTISQTLSNIEARWNWSRRGI